MQRKVIKQGNNTLTVTLPKAWTAQFRIKPGDEIAVEQKGNELVLSTSKSHTLADTEVDITGMDGSSIVLLIRGLYRKGYDRVILRTKDALVKHFRAGATRKVEDVITAEVNRLMGFELFEHDRGRFEIRSVSSGALEDFDATLRRIFLQTLQYYADVQAALQRKDIDALNTLIEKPDSLTKWISYASRLLNKQGYPKHDYTPFLYHLIESLELVNDATKNAARFALKHRIVFSPVALKLLKDIGGVLRLYYDTYYQFKLGAVAQYSQQRNSILEQIDAGFTRLQKGELAALAQLIVILDVIRESLRLRSALA